VANCVKNTSEITVNLIGNHAPIFLRQSPANDGVWEDVRFLINAPEPTDYCVVLNGVQQPLKVNCRRENIWLLMQEPPTDVWKLVHRGNEDYGRIFTQDTDLAGSPYVWAQPAINWRVNRSYAELANLQPCPKSRQVSAVISDKFILPGQRARLAFLEQMKDCMALDHYGMGFHEIFEKWEALAPYRYSFAAENYRNSFYWTEKIADCFLAWTMPIYCGCTRISSYFPAEAMISIDMDAPHAIDKIREAIADDAWGKNREAIEHARNLVLQRYQLLPFIANQIHGDISSCGGVGGGYSQTWIHPVMVKPGFTEQCRKYAQRVRGMGKKLFLRRSELP
jgi:hypothetical protein